MHLFILKQNTNEATCCLQLSIEYISPFIRTRYSIPIAINTHIDCSNNSKCSVRCIFKATARSRESVTLSIFCYNQAIHHEEHNFVLSVDLKSAIHHNIKNKGLVCALLDELLMVTILMMILIFIMTMMTCPTELVHYVLFCLNLIYGIHSMTM